MFFFFQKFKTVFIGKIRLISSVVVVVGFLVKYFASTVQIVCLMQHQQQKVLNK